MLFGKKKKNNKCFLATADNTVMIKYVGSFIVLDKE